MADGHKEGCYVAHDALNLAREVDVRMNALTRRVDQIDADKMRLGDRVTAIDERMTDHESVTNRAVKKMNDTLDGLSDTVGSLKQTLEAALAAPPIPGGMALIQSWRETPPSAKAKIGAVIVGLLVTPEVLKPLIATAFAVIKRWLHVP